MKTTVHLGNHGQSLSIVFYIYVLIYPLYIIDGFRILQQLCTKSNMVLYLTACLNYLSAKSLHTRYEIASDFVLPRFETIRYGKHSVRYLGLFLWSKLTDNQRDSPSLHDFINKIRTLNLADLLTNNSNCCNLCSQ